MAETTSLPLCERKFRDRKIQRAIELVILLLLLSLLGYRILTLRDNGYPWLLALVCESWFTFNWILTISNKWSQLLPKTYPERVIKRVAELPAVDMFVTTADPELEPPIMTVNTVLSLLAVDYPTNKLACYVSDDAASPLTFYSLSQASKFAQLWVPFCKKYNISLRAPFRYFKGEATNMSQDTSSEFQEDWKRVKDEYAKLCEKITDASIEKEKSDLPGEYEVFSDIDRRNHPSIIKVIWENQEALSDGVPHLIYVSREKRPKQLHNFKAGAMNVLTRVSGVMTNAPFMLNVDCDMHVNNPQVVLHAMCLIFGSKHEIDSGFVQLPQQFYDGLKDDPFGNQMVVLMEFMGRGIAGIQGPFYQGTGCFHRRKVIYGLSPDDKVTEGNLSDENLQKKYGKSMEFIKSAAKTISTSGMVSMETSGCLSTSIKAACDVAGCGYETGTTWGEKVGWLYGSVTEDVLTGLTIHSLGWRSAYCTPDPPGFLGCTPTAGPTILIQQKRWSTGLFEILFTSKSPFILTFTRKLQFRQCLAYMWILVWALRSVYETCYAVLPAYCLISNSHFLPKADEPAILIPISTLVIYNLFTLSEYLQTGLSVRAWWNNQRMWRIYPATAWLFGLLSVTIKLFGFSASSFEVTKKDDSNSCEDQFANKNVGRFTFDDSPIYIPGIWILLVNLTALAVHLLGIKQTTYAEQTSYTGEIICSVVVVAYLWVFLKGLFSKGKFGIPSSTVIKSGALTVLFVNFCRRVQ